MSQQALSKARSHFDHSPFELIFRDLVQQRYCGEHEIHLWHDYQPGFPESYNMVNRA
jgi:hypothetical protein